MLKVNNLIGFGNSIVDSSLMSILTSLNLTTSLNLCLDVGDILSYPGTGNTWTDRSGGGNNYTNGAGALTAANFTGVAGDLAETTYWLFNGTDGFGAAATQTFAGDWHKNNGLCSCIAVYYSLANKSTDGAIWANRTTSAFSAGIMFRVADTNKPLLSHSTSSTGSEVITGTLTVPGGWNFLGYSYSETITDVIFRVNSSTETIDTAASTDTDAVTGEYCISSTDLTNTSSFENTERLMCLALWSRVLSDAEMESIYLALKARRVPSLP